MSSKKAQLGLIELLMVLLVLAVLLSIGLFVYFQFFKADLDQTRDALENQESNVLLAYAINMPELECSRATATQNCLDAMKLLAAQDTFARQENRPQYVDTFGFRTLKFELLYPTTTQQACTGSTYPDCSTYTLYVNKPASINSTKSYSVITPLYYPDSKSVKIGRLILEVYEQ